MGTKLPIAEIMICIAMVFASCTKTADGTQGLAGPAGPAGTSVTDKRSGITGYVNLVNQYTFPVSEYDSVKVSTLMGDSALSVLTDATGKFLLPNLKSGTYRILFQRNGYDSFGVSVSHAAGNEDKFIGIVQLDGTQTTRLTGQTIQLLPYPFDASKYIDLVTTITGPAISDSTRRYFYFYFSSSPSVNSNNYLFSDNTNTQGNGGNQIETQIFFDGSNINSTRFSPGDTVYMKTYIVPPYSFMTSWFDTNTYQTITYPYVGDSLSNYFIWSN